MSILLFWMYTFECNAVLNVSGHRLGTAEVESALVLHPMVVEAAVVGVPHDIKGMCLAVFWGVSGKARNFYQYGTVSLSLFEVVEYQTMRAFSVTRSYCLKLTTVYFLDFRH